MSEQRRFGESDHEPLQQDDVLTQAIGEWRDELPTRDLWAGISTRIESQPVAELGANGRPAGRRVVPVRPFGRSGAYVNHAENLRH